MDIRFYQKEFIQLCENRNIDPTKFYDKMKDKTTRLKNQWNQSLKNHFQKTPDFNHIQIDCFRHFKQWDFKNKISIQKIIR